MVRRIWVFFKNNYAANYDFFFNSGKGEKMSRPYRAL
jgi:hypothetical protein